MTAGKGGGGLTPGVGGIATVAATGAGISAAVLPKTGANWLIPAAAGVVAVLAFWGVLYAIKNRVN